MPTITELLAVPSFGAYNGPFYCGITALRFNGARIGDLPPDLGLLKDVETTIAEVVSVANTLVSTGFAEANLVKRAKSPDFEVETPQGSVFVEHTRAYPGCQRDSAMRVMKEAASVMADSAVAHAIGNRTVVMTLDHSEVEVGPLEALVAPCPGKHVSKTEARTMVREIRELALGGFFARCDEAKQTTIPASAGKTLAKYRATCLVGEATAPDRVGISVGSRRFIPRKASLWDACMDRIRAKSNEARKYEVLPDWLVIQPVQQADEFVYDLAGRASIDISPFRKVLVLHWHDARPYVAEWTATADGTSSANVPELPEIIQPYDAPLHDWARRVDEVLDRYRIPALLAADGGNADVPEMCSSPLGVEWYRRWMGRHPWVTCASTGDRIGMRFWTAGDWDGGEAVEVDATDVEGAAKRIWDFLREGTDAAPIASL